MNRLKLWMGVLLCGAVAGCSAPPEDVCEHIEEVVAQDVGEEAAAEAIDGCMFTWEMRRDTRSVIAYKELADCVMDSDDLASLAQCK